MTNIFLTGITGLVGGAFTAALLKERNDVKVVALTRSNSVRTARQRVEEILGEQCQFDGCPEALPEIMKSIEVIDGDVTM